MKEIKVLGSGCAKCVKTAELIYLVASDCGASVHVVKESRPEVIMKYGVMSTPAVIVDNQLMHSESVPDRKKIEEWLKWYRQVNLSVPDRHLSGKQKNYLPGRAPLQRIFLYV